MELNLLYELSPRILSSQEVKVIMSEKSEEALFIPAKVRQSTDLTYSEGGLTKIACLKGGVVVRALTAGAI